MVVGLWFNSKSMKIENVLTAKVLIGRLEVLAKKFNKIHEKSEVTITFPLSSGEFSSTDLPFEDSKEYQLLSEEFVGRIKAQIEIEIDSITNDIERL